MLSKRYAEAIELNKNEMAMFIRTCDRLIEGLESQIQQRKAERESFCAPESLLSVSLNLLQRREIVRLVKTVEDATDLFEKVVDGFIYEEEGYLDEVEQGEAEDQLLDALGDYNISSSESDSSVSSVSSSEDNADYAINASTNEHIYLELD